MAGRKDHPLVLAVLDTNEQSRQFMVALLEGLEMGEVVALATPEACLEWLAAGHRPDVLLIDMALVPMSGVAFTRYLRHVVGGRAAYLPVILTGQRADRDALAEARNAGVNEFIAKPISAAGLAARLHAVLEAPRPMVRTGDYFGPDRRRRQVSFSGGDRRGSGHEEV
ncbi:response regulator [Pararhodospirillum photometricum]|nr:response regulator [Pararhodospirillum photometricum]